MRFIITIDDAEEETLKTLLEENINIPLVIGLPVGLLNKNFEDKRIASKELVFKLIKNLDIEITSHGYFHNLPSLGFQKNLKIFISRIKSAPDKFDYLFRALNFKKEMVKAKVNQKNDRYNISQEIAKSKRALERHFKRKISAFLYPGGYITSDLLKQVSENYSFARASDIGVNTINDFKQNPDRFLLKTISISKYTNFLSLERYYKKLLAKENTDNEYVIIETYHTIVDKPNGLYNCSFKSFKSHLVMINKIGKICKFTDIEKIKLKA